MRQALIGLLVFFPSPGGDPAPHGVTDVWLTTRDGVKLHAFHAPASPGAPTLLWSHGNAGNISQRLPVLLAFQALGLNVLAYDYRGYGRSADVRPTEDGVYADAQAAYDWAMAQGVAPQQLVLFGESLGGAVSLALAQRNSVAGVALLSTFTSLRDVGRVHYGPLALAAGDSFDSATRISALTVPLLIQHGSLDEIIPLDHGKQLARRAGARAQFVTLEGGNHNDVLGWPAVLARVADFAHRVTAATP